MDAKEGPCIRINTDVHAARNLIEVTLVYNDAAVPQGAQFLLRRETAGANAPLAVFLNNNRTGRPAFGQNDQDATHVFQGSPPHTIWVEWQTDTHGTNTLAFEVHDQASPLGEDDKFGCDKVRFHTFRSIVIVLGGLGQGPSDPADPNEQTFDSSIQLYRKGYDSQMFNQNAVGGDGTGSAITRLSRPSMSEQSKTSRYSDIAEVVGPLMIQPID
jgi:hypothetical protein